MYSEYTMSPKMTSRLLKIKKKKKIKGTDQKYLCEYVNREINPLYPCRKVMTH